MSSKEHLLQKAVAFFQNGDCETARRLLQSILADDPDFEPAWIWYADTFPNLADRQRILGDVLNRNPRLHAVRRAYQLLQQSRRRLFGEPDVIPVTAGAAGAMTRPIWPVAAGAARKPDKRLAAPVREQISLWIPAALLLFALMASTLFFFLRASMLRQENTHLKIDNQVMQIKIGRMEKELEKLKVNLDLLAAQNIAMNDHYGSLAQKFDALNADYLKLKSDYQALSQNHSTQESSYRELENRYKELQARYTELANLLEAWRMRFVALPPAIPIQQPGMSMVFRKLDGTYLRWVIPAKSLESEAKRAADARRAEKTVTLSSKDGQHSYTFHDARAFIDAQVFNQVISELYAQSPNEDAFIRETWNLVRQLNINQADPRVDTPRAPLETLQASGGDSEDAAILFASLIKAAPVKWQVKLLYLNADTPTVDRDPNHIIVQVNTGRATYLVDPSSKENMNPYPANLDGWFFEL